MLLRNVRRSNGGQSVNKIRGDYQGSGETPLCEDQGSAASTFVLFILQE